MAALSVSAAFAAACSLLAPSGDAITGEYAGDTDAATDASDAATADAAVSCVPGTKPCEGVCVSTASPETGCAGSSCAPCRYAHAQALCIAGACAMGACENGFASCNDDAADGCETDTRTTSKFCGSCLLSCTGVTPLCSDGRCVERCHAVKTTSTSARIRFANAGLDLGTGDFTVELWARRHADFVSVENTLVATNGDYWQNAVAVRWAASRVICDIVGTVSAPLTVQAPPPTDQAWHHLACVRESGVLRLFVDGKLVASGASTHALTAASPGSMASFYGLPAMSVFLGPTRLSRSARYSAAFSPRWHWDVDASTIAQFLVTSGFDGSGFADEAGGDNGATATGGVVAADEEAPCQ